MTGRRIQRTRITVNHTVTAIMVCRSPECQCEGTDPSHEARLYLSVAGEGYARMFEVSDTPPTVTME